MSEKKLMEKSDVQLVVVDYQTKLDGLSKNLVNNTRLNTVLEEIADQLDLKVDKKTGKSLVDDDDIKQITTNKNDIESINELLNGLAEFLEENI